MSNHPLEGVRGQRAQQVLQSMRDLIIDLQGRAEQDGNRAQDYFDKLKTANAKLDEIREFVQQWQSAAENMDTGNLRMGDIAEVLDQ